MRRWQALRTCALTCQATACAWASVHEMPSAQCCIGRLLLWHRQLWDCVPLGRRILYESRRSSKSPEVVNLCLHAGAFNATQDWEELAEEYSQLYPVEVTQALLNGSFHDPDFDVSSLLPSGVSFTDPEFFNDMGSNVSSTLQVRGCLMMRSLHHACCTPCAYC